jgi:uncharacterized protein YeaO (DUF488 family)
MKYIMPSIRTKRVYETPDATDGLRVLVDRMWPRGMTKRRIRADLWLKSVAPSTALRNWFKHDRSRWNRFKERYFSELEQNPEGVDKLMDAVKNGPVTLLYSAKDATYNQAVALKEYLSARPSN